MAPNDTRSSSAGGGGDGPDSSVRQGQSSTLQLFSDCSLGAKNVAGTGKPESDDGTTRSSSGWSEDSDDAFGGDRSPKQTEGMQRECSDQKFAYEVPSVPQLVQATRDSVAIGLEEFILYQTTEIFDDENGAEIARLRNMTSEQQHTYLAKAERRQYQDDLDTLRHALDKKARQVREMREAHAQEIATLQQALTKAKIRYEEAEDINESLRHDVEASREKAARAREELRAELELEYMNDMNNLMQALADKGEEVVQLRRQMAGNDERTNSDEVSTK